MLPRKALISLCSEQRWRRGRAGIFLSPKGFVSLVFLASLAREARQENFGPERLCFPYVLSIPGAQSSPAHQICKPEVMVMVIVMGGGSLAGDRTCHGVMGGGTEARKQL